MTGQEDGLICKLHRSFDLCIYGSILLIVFSSVVKFVGSHDVRFQHCQPHVHTQCKSEELFCSHLACVTSKAADLQTIGHILGHTRR